jgi:hypothetical protein
MTRVGWFLLVLGLAIGFILGLYYTWQVNPVEHQIASPGDLSETFQDQYRTLIAVAYESSGDIKRALRRLEQFGDTDPALTMSALSQQLLAEDRSNEEVRAVAALAAALAEIPAPKASTPETISTKIGSAMVQPPGATTPTITSRPASTLTPTTSPFFRLISKRKICDADLSPPLIQVNILDARGDPVPGTEVKIIWDLGEEHFFTGLKPELGLGYADFAMTEGMVYSLQLVKGSEPVSGLQSEACQGEGGQTFPGSWMLVFQAP